MEMSSIQLDTSMRCGCKGAFIVPNSRPTHRGVFEQEELSRMQFCMTLGLAKPKMPRPHAIVADHGAVLAATGRSLWNEPNGGLPWDGMELSRPRPHPRWISSVAGDRRAERRPARRSRKRSSEMQTRRRLYLCAYAVP